MLWTNELSAWYKRMCVISLYTGEGIFTYYRPSNSRPASCFNTKRRVLSAVFVLVLHGCEIIPLKTKLKALMSLNVSVLL